MLAQVMTHHQAVIAVEQLEITSPEMYNKWDMIKQAVLSDEEEKPEGTTTVAVNKVTLLTKAAHLLKMPFIICANIADEAQQKV